MKKREGGEREREVVRSEKRERGSCKKEGAFSSQGFAPPKQM